MAEVKLSPELRFPEFSEDWLNKRYNQVFSFYSTNSFSRDKLNYENGEVKNIHYGDIHTKFSTLFDVEKEIVPFVNSEIDLGKIKDENYLQIGDLLIADASENYDDIGKTVEVINLNNEKVISGLHTFHARPDKFKMYIGFSGFMLQHWSNRKQVMQIAQGTKVLGLATSRLGKIKINFPSLPEQQKIATFLTAVDERIQLLQDKKTKLEAYKKGVMQKLFSQEIRFKDENGNPFSDWQVKKLGNMCSITTGKLDANAMVETGAYRFYTCAKDYYWIDKYAFDFEALLISGNGANVGYIHHYNGKFNAYQRTYVLYDLSIDYVYVKYYLNQNLKRRIHRERKDGNTPYIVLDTLSELELKVPQLKEQQKIATFLSSIDESIEAVSKEIEGTTTFKKGLLQKMFV